MKPLLQSRRKSHVDLEAEAKNLPLFQLPIPTATTAASPPQEKKAEKGPSLRAETQEESGREAESKEKKEREEKEDGLSLYAPEHGLVHIGREVGIKHDTGKLRWDLLPYEGLIETVRVVTFGATKYGPGNWRHLSDPDGRYFAAAMRHMVAWQTGERTDPETGLSHLAHAACNLLFLMWFDKDRK